MIHVEVSFVTTLDILFTLFQIGITTKEPITKDKKSGRRVTKESRQGEMKEEEQEVEEDTNHQLPEVSAQSRPKKQYALEKKLDRQQLTSPPRPIPKHYS